MDPRQLVTDAAFELVPGAVPATVTPKGGAPVDCQIVWHSPIVEGLPSGLDLQRMTSMENMSIRLADVPVLPEGSVVLAPELLGGVPQSWRVHAHLFKDSTSRRVGVIPDE